MKLPTRWTLAVALLALLAASAGLHYTYRRLIGRPATAACRSSNDCVPGTRCVVPGVCSHACKTDTDCPPDRRCAELRAIEGEDESRPITATTCVLATPG